MTAADLDASDLELTAESLRILAAREGISLSDEQLDDLLGGVQRARARAAALRPLLRDDLEPATIFIAPEPTA